MQATTEPLSMEEYFGIKYEFDVSKIHENIAKRVEEQRVSYVCAPDCNVLTNVHCNEAYRSVVNGAMFSICDSSWVPIFIKWIYGKKYHCYRGSDIFMDIIKSRRYRMYFLGADKKTVTALKENIKTINPDVANMTFKELPFCKVEEFDYASIANDIENDGADIVWIALGAPKQELFMSMLAPHLKKGVCIAVGAVFNFFSGLPGLPKSAPRWMVGLHIEFIHRILWEPKKQLKRCWGIIAHLPRILLKERHRKYHHL